MRLNFFAMTSAALVAYGVTAINLYSMQQAYESNELAQSYQDDYSHDLSQTYVQNAIQSLDDAKKAEKKAADDKK